jgi:hypothetical protein
MSLRSLSRRFYRSVSAAAVIIATASWGTNAWAVLLAYEGFNYDPIANIVGLNGGTGWSAGWGGSANRTSIVAGGLSYTDASGNTLVTSGNRARGSGQNGNADNTRDIPTTQNTGTTWWSFIGQRIRRPELTTDAENVARASGLQLFESTTEKLSVGKGTTNLATPENVTYNWSMLHSGSVANAVQTTKPILEQAFLLVRIDHLGTTSDFDNGYLWVNPLLDAEPNIATADAKYEPPTSRDFTYNRVRVFSGNNQTVSSVVNPYAVFDIDEIRIGTTFADVTPHTTAGGQQGDFNGDNTVDAADYVVWRDSIMTDETYNQWRSNFGAGTAAGATTAAAAPVPEPVALVMSLFAASLGLVCRGKR